MHSQKLVPNEKCMREKKRREVTRNGSRKWNRFAGIGQRQKSAPETRHRTKIKMFEADCASARVNNPPYVCLCAISYTSRSFVSRHTPAASVFFGVAAATRYSCKQFIPMRIRYIAARTEKCFHWKSFYLSSRIFYFVLFNSLKQIHFSGLVCRVLCSRCAPFPFANGSCGVREHLVRQMSNEKCDFQWHRTARRARH